MMLSSATGISSSFVPANGYDGVSLRISTGVLVGMAMTSGYDAFAGRNG